MEKEIKIQMIIFDLEDKYKKSKGLKKYFIWYLLKKARKEQSKIKIDYYC